MNYFSDALTVGLVLVLLFGSIALYLYTRIQQTEQKNSLLESILLDLKMNAEIKSYSELPAEEEEVSSPAPLMESYKSFDEGIHSELPSSEEELKEVVVESMDVTDYKSIIDDAVKEVTDASVSYEEESSYELMTLKELQAMAKSKGISGASGMKKNALIDALKAQDHSSTKSGLEDSLSHE